MLLYPLLTGLFRRCIVGDAYTTDAYISESVSQLLIRGLTPVGSWAIRGAVALALLWSNWLYGLTVTCIDGAAPDENWLLTGAPSAERGLVRVVRGSVHRRLSSPGCCDVLTLAPPALLRDFKPSLKSKKRSSNFEIPSHFKHHAITSVGKIRASSSF